MINWFVPWCSQINECTYMFLMAVSSGERTKWRFHAWIRWKRQSITLAAENVQHAPFIDTPDWTIKLIPMQCMISIRYTVFAGLMQMIKLIPHKNIISIVLLQWLPLNKKQSKVAEDMVETMLWQPAFGVVSNCSSLIICSIAHAPSSSYILLSVQSHVFISMFFGITRSVGHCLCHFMKTVVPNWEISKTQQLYGRVILWNMLKPIAYSNGFVKHDSWGYWMHCIDV